MTMHKVHFINGTEEIFFDIISCQGWTFYKGYSDASNNKPVSIPMSSVLYVEVMSR